MNNLTEIRQAAKSSNQYVCRVDSIIQRHKEDPSKEFTQELWILYNQAKLDQMVDEGPNEYKDILGGILIERVGIEAFEEGEWS